MTSILIVEDDPSLGFTLKLDLETEGYKRAAVDRAARRWRRLRRLRRAGARVDARVARRVRAWFYWWVARRMKRKAASRRGRQVD